MFDTAAQPGKAILHAIPLPAIIMTSDLQIVDVNAAFASVVARERVTLLGKQLFDEFPSRPDSPNLEAAIRASVQRALASGRTDALPPGRHDIVLPDIGYETRYWRLSHSPILEGERSGDILQLVEDVTAEVTSEKLREARERTAAEGAALSFWDLNLVTGDLIRSPAVDRLHGFEPGEAGGNIEAFLDRVHPDDREQARANAFSAAERGPGPTILEHRLLLPDGRVRWISARGEIVIGPVNDEPHLVGMVVDVTEFREQEAELRNALASQKLLLDEMNHRVKNSLQMVASLLNLECARASAETRGKLLSASARVNAIATIHASLYQDGDVASVAVDSQLRELCEHLISSTGCDIRGIRVQLDVAPLRLCPDKAISISIIVNELVTNSLKHAFHDREQGMIEVQLKRDGGGSLLLTVRDDGHGARDGLDREVRRSSGLGERLVQMSARKLGGRVEHSHDQGGWETTVLLPAAES